ncbi:PREDICTED: probable serine/threonine-protein kinase DDB_G0282963 isoform X2 [Polistes dominula]|uniref:Probable serine/threonine-protein kinase DDB_G0282963 isoform X2 n=1 Tax=Polistes dominula TaxID=743375 RepID=A0ABM1HXG5_POLDO|nr:PREDICTED: probable serine/threonine-protein kinase DDB_G0282963 isoform X2 [Polistes dominula]
MRKTRIPAPSTSMEIPKTVQEQIYDMQNKMKNAIRDHTIYFGQLKDDPNNTIILGQIQAIHLRIISLNKNQKQVLDRLRKEVDEFNAQNANGPKVSLASLLGLNNNNNHITNNNDKKSSKVVGNDGNNLDVKISKDDYEDTVRNSDDVPSPSQENSTSKDRSSSVETISGGEDDVIEVSMDENSNETQEELDEKNFKQDVKEKITFLSNLSLITKSRCSELQNKRVERKRRSTANPQFVYSNFEAPMKKKKCTYLQSGGSAPQTRQTTARMNGPSPPPVSKTALPKSTSLPSKTTIGKSLIPLQKSMTRPNILRNASESKVYPGKGKIENGSNSSMSLPIVPTKTIQSTGSRTVHIPGLPSCLTIERIENDSIVCIRCRNPGTLTVCENCSANYHVSCHSVSPAPPRICPKCAFVEDDEEEEEEEEEEDAVVQEAEEEDEREEFNGRESCNKEEELEEKERERYELRERNSDLRLQVYELEKRSQLLGQSLELQHRTRQELLGKQERTQKSIKRLVDFIKLMQLRKDTCSPPRSESDSFHPQPFSSQSPRVMSPPQTTSTRQSVQQQSHQELTLSNQRSITATVTVVADPILRSSSTICHSQTSATCSRSPSCHIPPTSCQSVTTSNQKSINHTLSLKKSKNQSEGLASSSSSSSSNLPTLEHNQKDRVFQHSSTPNCQPRLGTNHTFTPRSPSPTLPSTLKNISPSRSTTIAIATAATTTTTTTTTEVEVKKQIEQYQGSTASSIPKNSPLLPTTVRWNDRSATARSPEPADNRESNSVSIIYDQQQETRGYSYPPTTVAQYQTNNYQCQTVPTQKRHFSVIGQRIEYDQEIMRYSNLTAQVTTPPPPPVSSPTIPVLSSREPPVIQTTKTAQTCTNNRIAKLIVSNQSNNNNNNNTQTNTTSAESSPSSSNT